MFSCSKELVLCLNRGEEEAKRRVRDACAGHDMRKQKFVLEFDLIPALERILLLKQRDAPILFEIVASLFRTRRLDKESEYGKRLIESRLVEICSASNADVALVAMLDFSQALVLRMQVPRNASVVLQQKFAACLVWEKDTSAELTCEEREFLKSIGENVPCCLPVLWWNHDNALTTMVPKEDFVTALWRQALNASSPLLSIKPLVTARNMARDSTALLEWVVNTQHGALQEDADMLLFQCQTELPTLNVDKHGVELCAALACAPNTNLCLLMLPTVILPLYNSSNQDVSRFALATLIACTRNNSRVGRRLLTLWTQDSQNAVGALQRDSCFAVELVFNLTHCCFEAIHQLIHLDPQMVDFLLEHSMSSNDKALQCLSAFALSKHHATLQRLASCEEIAKLCMQPNKSKYVWIFLQALAFALPNAMKQSLLQRTDITWERLVVMEAMPFWSNLMVGGSGVGSIALVSAMLTLLASENQPENEPVAVDFLANLSSAGGELNVFRMRILNDIRLVSIIQHALQQHNSAALRCVSNMADDYTSRSKLRGLFAALILDFLPHEQRAQDLLAKLT